MPANGDAPQSSKVVMEPREQTIAERVLEGETEAFREVVEAHGRNLYRLACRMTGNPAVAEDVVQEAFLRAYRNLSSFDGSSKLQTWLHRITANAALDELRRQKRTRLRFVPLEPEGGAERAQSEAPGPDRHAMSREIDIDVAEALETLSPMERTAFVLRHFEHQTSAEIGRALGTREIAARQAIFRAVHKLRKILTPHQEIADAAL